MVNWLRALTCILLFSITKSEDGKPVYGQSLRTFPNSKAWAVQEKVLLPRDEVTICFWWKSEDTKKTHSILSLGELGEFVKILVTSLGKKIEFLRFDNQNEEAFDILENNWYFFCLVVNLDWLVKFHIGTSWPNLNWVKSVENGNSNPTPLIKSVETVMALFSVIQNSLSFDSHNLNQLGVGTLACLNIWSSAYKKEKLKLFANCLEKGDALAMNVDKFVFYGTKKIQRSLGPPILMTPAAETTSSDLITKSLPATSNSITSTVNTMNWMKFVSYKGQYMLDLSVYRLPYPSALACLHICASISCEHVNYRHFDHECELGHIKGTQSMVFISMEGATYYRPATDNELV